MKILTDAPASYIIKATGIKRRNFFFRVTNRQVAYIEPFKGQRYYSIASWNRLNPDYKVE